MKSKRSDQFSSAAQFIARGRNFSSSNNSSTTASPIILFAISDERASLEKEAFRFRKRGIF
jgi:hypothetical protein